MRKPLLKLGKKKFEAMAEEATVDCYNPSEQVSGWFTMLDEHLKVPFQTQILGMPATVEKIDLNPNEDIVAICRRGKHRQTVSVLDLPLSRPTVAGRAANSVSRGPKLCQAVPTTMPSGQVSTGPRPSRMGPPAAAWAERDSRPDT